MNILQQEDLIKGAPDQALLEEAQNPTGQVPQYLVISEIKRRTDMRKRFEAEEQQPTDTVAEQIVDEGMGGSAPPPMAPQGAPMPPQNGMPPQMPSAPPQMPPAPVSAQMPPEMLPPEMLPPEMLPPEMMAAMNGMPPPGMMPPQMMSNGGMIGSIEEAPNAILEDARKFRMDSMENIPVGDMMAMSQAVDMGIPSVLPMAGGGVVRMQEGEQVPETSVVDKGGEVLDRIIDYYTDEDDTVDWSKVAWHAANVGIALTPFGLAAKGAQLASKVPAAYKGISALIKSRKAIPGNVRVGLGRKIATKLGVTPPGLKITSQSKKAKAFFDQLAREHPYRATGLAAQTAGKAALSPLAAAHRRYPKLTALAGITGVQAGTGGWPFGGSEPARKPGDTTEEILAEQDAENQGRLDVIDYINQQNMSSGGVVKMQAGRITMTDDEIAAALQALESQGITTPQQHQGWIPRSFTPAGPGPRIDSGYTPTLSLLDPDPITPPVVAEVVPEPVVPDQSDQKAPVGTFFPQQSTNQQLLNMLTERTKTIDELLKTETTLPDYEALRAGITEGVKDDASSAILLSIAKSIYEGKGLAGTDLSGAQAIKQKAKDALNALELAKVQGASAKEVADLERNLNAQTALLGAIPGLQAAGAGLSPLSKLQNELARMRAANPNDPRIPEHEKIIAKMTDPTIANQLAKLLEKRGGVRSYDPGTGEWTTVHGDEALSAAEQHQWDEGMRIGILEQIVRNQLAGVSTP